MAFPTIQTADTKNGTQTSNSASWTLTYPTNLASGDLILGFLGADGDNSLSLPAGFEQQGNSPGAVQLWVFAKVSDGTETGTFTATLGAAEQGGWRIFRVTGWHGSGITNLNGAGIAIATTVTGSPSANPNPPSLDPANWATEDTLWFATCAVDTSRTISVYPLANNQTADVSGGSTGATLGVCTLNDAVGSKDPGTFTASASDDWAAATVAVRPATVVVPPPRYGYVNYQDPGVL